MPIPSLTKSNKIKKGLKIPPRFCPAGADPFDVIEWEKRSSVISNPDGSVVFKMENARIPKGWSQVATDIIAQKYFRRAGVPVALKKVHEADIPEWLQRSVPDSIELAKLPEDKRFVGERDSAQVFHRLAGCWAYWG